MPRVRNDLEIYERRAADWWNPKSRWFRSLHRASAFHRARLRDRWRDRLRNARWVDLGAGGGLLSVPFLADIDRLTAVDLSPASLEALRTAAGEGADRVETVERNLCDTGLPAACADLVTLSDVVEHVADPGAALAEAARLLRPGGELFVNTINRTVRAKWLAVHLAEGIGLIPRGTHDPRMFVTPDELVDAASRAGLRLVAMEGQAPRIAATVRSWAIELRPARSKAVAYSAFFR